MANKERYTMMAVIDAHQNTVPDAVVDDIRELWVRRESSNGAYERVSIKQLTTYCADLYALIGWLKILDFKDDEAILVTDSW